MEKYHLNMDEIESMPIYLACILCGAISPDHTNVKMSWKDNIRYYSGDPKRMAMLEKVSKILRGLSGGRRRRKPRELTGRIKQHVIELQKTKAKKDK